MDSASKPPLTEPAPTPMPPPAAQPPNWWVLVLLLAITAVIFAACVGLYLLA